MQCLTEQLPTEQYLRRIDLSFNKISEPMILGAFIDALTTNQSLINLDLSENPGHTTEVKEKVALCLLKNMEVVKNAEEPIRPAWLDPNQI